MVRMANMYGVLRPLEQPQIPYLGYPLVELKVHAAARHQGISGNKVLRSFVVLSLEQHQSSASWSTLAVQSVSASDCPPGEALFRDPSPMLLEKGLHFQEGLAKRLSLAEPP